MKFIVIFILIVFSLHGTIGQTTNSSINLNPVLMRINRLINTTCTNATMIQNALKNITIPRDKIDAQAVITKFMQYELRNLGYSSFFNNQSLLSKINSTILSKFNSTSDKSLLTKIAGFFNASSLKTIDAGFICRGLNRLYPLLESFSNINSRLAQYGVMMTIQKFQANVQAVAKRFYEENKALVDRMIKNQPKFIEAAKKYSGVV